MTEKFIFEISNDYLEAYDNFSLFCLLDKICSDGYFENGNCLQAANKGLIYKIINNIK